MSFVRTLLLSLAILIAPCFSPDAPSVNVGYLAGDPISGYEVGVEDPSKPLTRAPLVPPPKPFFAVGNLPVQSTYHIISRPNHPDTPWNLFEEPRIYSPFAGYGWSGYHIMNLANGQQPAMHPYQLTNPYFNGFMNPKYQLNQQQMMAGSMLGPPPMMIPMNQMNPNAVGDFYSQKNQFMEGGQLVEAPSTSNPAELQKTDEGTTAGSQPGEHENKGLNSKMDSPQANIEQPLQTEENKMKLSV